MPYAILSEQEEQNGGYTSDKSVILDNELNVRTSHKVLSNVMA
jgi:hypothetical protein